VYRCNWRKLFSGRVALSAGRSVFVQFYLRTVTIPVPETLCQLMNMRHWAKSRNVVILRNVSKKKKKKTRWLNLQYVVLHETAEARSSPVQLHFVCVFIY